MELKIRIEPDVELENEIEIENSKLLVDVGTQVLEEDVSSIMTHDDSSISQKELGIEIIEKTSILQPLILFVTMGKC